MANQLLSVKFPARLLGMDAFTEGDLAPGGEIYLFVLTATFGDGERPDQAAQFWDYLQQQSAGSLSHVVFAVFGLGASKYGSNFCKV